MANFHARVAEETKIKLRLLALHHDCTLGQLVDELAQREIRPEDLDQLPTQKRLVYLRADVNEDTKKRIGTMRILHSATTEEILLALAGEVKQQA